MSPSLLFDLDGCLVDSLPAIRHCWERTLPRFGASPPADVDLRRLAGPPVDEAARTLLPGASADTIAELVSAYRRCSVDQVGAIEAFPGVPEMLAELCARGVTLAVATSKSIEVAEPALQALGLRGCFAVVAGTRVDEPGADKATVVARALEALDGERPLGLVGDRAHDVAGARAHGLECFGALWGYGGRDELQRAGADALVATPGDVPALVADRLAPREQG